MASKLSLFLAELKRRKVYQVAAVYVAVGVAISLGVPDLFSAFDLPSSAARLVIILIVIGFPIALVLAWAYEVKPEEPREAAAVPAPVVATSESDRKSIVVLPFDNMSPDPEMAFFSDGLTEELIADLSKAHDLRVISRTSAMSFKGTTKTVPTIARELDVRYALEGSVRRAGDSLRITAQLIDASTDTHLWAEKYDGTLEDVFDIQESVSRSIVDALELRLTRTEAQQMAKRSIEDIRAYDCYLRARAAIGPRTEVAYDEAVRQLQAGLKVEGDNALLLATLGYVHVWYVHGWFRGDDALDDADEFAGRALALEPDTALAHVAIGFSGYYRGNRQWISAVERGCALDPNDPETLHLLGWGYVMTGRTSRAAEVGRRMFELDPVTPLSAAWSAIAQFYAGQFNTAVETLRAAKAPKYLGLPMFRWYFPYFLVYANHREEAGVILEAVDEWPDSGLFSLTAQLLRHILRGEKDRIPELLTDEFVTAARRDAAASCWVATLLAMSNDHPQALEWLEHAVSRGFINYPYLAEYDPFLARLRGERRFQELMARVEHEWETFEV